MTTADSTAAAHLLDPDAIRSLTELVGNDPEALVEIIDAFLDEAPQRLAELRQGIDDDDPVLAGRAAHTLKANGRTFGAERLASLCLDLETAARAHELAGAADLVDQADEEWVRVRAALTTLRDGAAS